MIVVAVAVVVGLGLLSWAPGKFVGGAASLARRWSVSPVIIGALILGLGTSAPEMLVGGLAAVQGDPAVGVGNIVGSNIANLALVLGVAGLVGSIGVAEGTLRTEVPLVVLATVGFGVAVQGGLSVAEGAALAVGLAVALAVTVRRASSHDAADADIEADVEEMLGRDGVSGRVLAVQLVVGLGGIIAGAQALVWGAVEVAESLDLSEGFVGMSLVAVGTSIPELVTSVSAVRAGEDDLVLGNVLGSNLFNSLAVGAVIGLADAGPLDDTALTTGGVILMLAVTGVAAAVMAIGRRVSKVEAGLLLAIYCAVMPLLAS